MYACNCNNRKGTGLFSGYQAFWIVVVIAIVIIWVHCGLGGWGGCGGNNIGCGCENECDNPCCNPCGC